MAKDLTRTDGQAKAAERSPEATNERLAAQRLLFAPSVEGATRAILVVDVFECVRLIEQDEEGTISCWLSLINYAEADLLEAGEVSRRQDVAGISGVRAAVSVALAIQHAGKRLNLGVPPERQMLLRMGIESSDVIIEPRDVYGHGVNFATRLASLAGPDEIVISARVGDQITPVLDADVKDLCDRFLKHVQHPVRAYRIGPPGPRPLIEPGFPLGELRPTLAVIPFTNDAIQQRPRLAPGRRARVDCSGDVQWERAAWLGDRRAE